VSRSISVRAVFQRAVTTYADQAPRLLPVTAVAAALVASLAVRPADSSLPLNIAALLIDTALFTVFIAFVIRVAADRWQGESAATTGQLLARVRPALGELVLVGVVAAITIGILLQLAALLFLGITLQSTLGSGSAISATHQAMVIVGGLLLLVPFAYALIRWSVVLPVVVLERPGRLRALGRSADLTRGNRLRVLSILVLVSVTLEVGSHPFQIVGIPANTKVEVAVGLLATFLLIPAALLSVTALYYELCETSAGST
jgi:hypothetical protein